MGHETVVGECACVVLFFRDDVGPKPERNQSVGDGGIGKEGER